MATRKPFRLPEKIVTLVFEDGPYQGLEVEVSLTAPQSLFWFLASLDDDEERTVDQVRDLMLAFGGQVRGWNLTDASGPVPATPQAFADRLDQATALTLIGRWAEAVKSPPAPLSPRPRRRRTSAQS